MSTDVVGYMFICTYNRTLNILYGLYAKYLKLIHTHLNNE